MPCKRKHVHGLDLPHCVAALREHAQIARERLGIAGDVDDAARRAAQQGVQKALVAPGAGRVQKDQVRPHPVRGHLLHVFARVPGGEPAVLQAVQPGVRDGVPHGVAVDLHADHLFGPGGGRDADGADAAVGVQHRLLPGQAREVHRCTGFI